MTVIYNGFISPEVTPYTHALCEKVSDLTEQAENASDSAEVIAAIDQKIAAIVEVLGRVEEGAALALGRSLDGKYVIEDARE